MGSVRASFLDVRQRNRPLSERYGGGRHGRQYVVLQLGARVGGGAKELPYDKSKMR